MNLDFLYDPCVYEGGAPLDKIDSLRSERVIWVDETPLPNWPGGNGFWLVLEHRLCSEVLKASQQFSSSLQGTQLRDPASREDLHYVQQMMLNMDPPDHTRLRRLMISAFSSRAIKALHQQIECHASQLVDTMINGRSSGECDFVKEVAADMPLLCLADIFGLPSSDRYLMFDWANRVIGYQDPDYALSDRHDRSAGTEIARQALALRPLPDANGAMPDPRSRAGMPDLYRYAHLLAEQKRHQPGNDVMSLLLAAIDDDGSRLTNAEFENMFWLFSVAGNETLRNGIPGGMIALLEHPESWRQLRQQPQIIGQAVNEMLRWWTPVMNFRRTARDNYTLGDKAIKAGDKVVVSFLAANRDPSVFSQPEQFNLGRSENPHLSFGYGPHYCIGAQLAVAQMQALFGELTRRISKIELAGEINYLRSNFQRGVKSLPIRWQV
ncbi:MAG: cytochrome P450 [Porticoccaceae bacterium]